MFYISVCVLGSATVCKSSASFRRVAWHRVGACGTQIGGAYLVPHTTQGTELANLVNRSGDRDNLYEYRKEPMLVTAWPWS